MIAYKVSIFTVIKKFENQYSAAQTSKAKIHAKNTSKNVWNLKASHKIENLVHNKVPMAASQLWLKYTSEHQNQTL